MLEVTEGVLMEFTDRNRQILEQVRAMGFKIALDDFGTGYSSLRYLCDFRFDKIKIDRAFVTGIHERKRAMTIIQSVVTLGRGLGMEIVAEGVETEAEASVMRLVGVTELQGFFFSQAVPAAEVAKLRRSLRSPGGRSEACDGCRSARSSCSGLSATNRVACAAARVVSPHGAHARRSRIFAPYPGFRPCARAMDKIPISRHANPLCAAPDGRPPAGDWAASGTRPDGDDGVDPVCAETRGRSRDAHSTENSTCWPCGRSGWRGCRQAEAGDRTVSTGIDTRSSRRTRTAARRRRHHDQQRRLDHDRSGRNGVTVDAATMCQRRHDTAVTNSNNMTGILLQGGDSGTITNSGTISFLEDDVLTDTDSDGNLDGNFAVGTNRHGILLQAGPTSPATSSIPA